MDVLITILCCLIVLSVLVFIHEGGHYIAAKFFGIRVSEFMLGLPGPNIGFKYKGTKFGLTCIPLGGYAKICGMEPGNLKPYLPEVLEFVHLQGIVNVNQVSNELHISTDEAQDSLDELCQWGCVCASKKSAESDKYFAADIGKYKLGQPREVKDKDKYFKDEYFCQYRSLSFWKRSIIILAGIFVNLLFAMLVFVILYSIVGVDIQYKDTGDISHVTLSPLQAIQYGFYYIGAVIQAVVNLFNPATAAETVSNSSSLIGIAIISKSAAEQGFWTFMEFMAMISVSLGIMNLLPIPPLDGGKFLVEIIQVVFKININEKVITYISLIGILIFFILFIFMINQDIQHFILG